MKSFKKKIKEKNHIRLSFPLELLLNTHSREKNVDSVKLWHLLLLQSLFQCYLCSQLTNPPVWSAVLVGILSTHKITSSWITKCNCKSEIYPKSFLIYKVQKISLINIQKKHRLRKQRKHRFASANQMSWKQSFSSNLLINMSSCPWVLDKIVVEDVTSGSFTILNNHQ